MIDRETAWCLLTVFRTILQTGKLQILKVQEEQEEHEVKGW
jgi:hypothetical protein